MLSGESNAGEWWKTTIGLIGKKATLHAQHTCFVDFFTVVSHDYNVKLPEATRFSEEMSYMFSFTSFSLSLIFTLGDRYLFPFCHCRYKIFMLFFQPKNVSFVFCFFLSLTLNLSLSFVRWASLACLLLSLFLCLSLSLYFKYVDMTINLSLIL